MIFRTLAGAALAVLAANTSPALAAQDSEGIICIPVLTLWSGTTAEIAEIERTPVPDSYRRKASNEPCNTLDRPSLIRWHLAFGSERSTTAALAWFEDDAMRGTLPAAAFLTGAEPAWRRAQSPLAVIAAHGRPASGEDRARARFVADPAIRALRPYTDALEIYVVLAQVRLAAAEFYRSPALLAAARRYLRPAGEGVRLFYADAPVAMADLPSPARALNLLSGTINQVRDLELRADVLQAAIGQSAADRAAARRTAVRLETGPLRAAADAAFEHGELCDVGDRSDLAAVKIACDEENDFEGRLFAYWRARARLELTDDPPATGAFDLAAKLYRHRLYDEEREGTMRAAATADILAELLLLRAEAEWRIAKDDYTRRYALDWLAGAARLITPANNPGRFRQVATRYATMWAALKATAAPDDRLDAGPEAREAAYLSRTLAVLPDIAAGRADR